MSADPLQSISSSSGDINTMKFAKLHLPKMKSVYWQHFGFPTNEDDRIITKQNVVCIICHKVLTNHGNTTNLRAHLQHRHKDVFRKLCAENDIKVPPRKQQLKFSTNTISMNQIKHEHLDRKIKMEYQDLAQETTATSSATATNSNNNYVGDEQSLYETIVPMTYDDEDDDDDDENAVIETEHYTKVEVGGHTLTDYKSVSSDEGQMLEERDMTTYHMDDIDPMEPYQLQEALVTMIIEDMRNIDILYDNGMKKLIRSLSGIITLPPEKKIESMLREMHSDKLTTLADQIKVHTQIKPYSLGFDMWTNVEQKHFLSIYFNFTTGGIDLTLLNQLYCTLEYNKYTSIEAVFADFNLINCTVAIVNYDFDDYLKHFLTSKNIPVVMAFDATINKCLRSTFSLPAVNTIINDVKEVFTQYATEINSKDVEVPVPNEDFPWTYFELLKFFSESVSWPEDVEALMNSAKTIVDVLNILAVTLDTLKGEDIPHSSMLSPVTAKILNKQLILDETDDDLTGTIKSVIAADLQKFVLSDVHLTISGLLDPRFHRLTSVENFENCLQILNNRYTKICEIVGNIPTPTLNKPTTNKSTLGKPIRKSNLELFFGLSESGNEKTKEIIENNVESDLRRFRREVHVNLDESPFQWWANVGHLYPALKSLSALYQCVPCFVNMNFKKPLKQQISEQQKRYNLNGSLLDTILFLNHHTKINT